MPVTNFKRLINYCYKQTTFSDENVTLATLYVKQRDKHDQIFLYYPASDYVAVLRHSRVQRALKIVLVILYNNGCELVMII